MHVPHICFGCVINLAALMKKVRYRVVKDILTNSKGYAKVLDPYVLASDG